jgi:hypothetical protein
LSPELHIMCLFSLITGTAIYNTTDPKWDAML